VEGEAGYFRSEPQCARAVKAVDLAELNRRLLDDCYRDEQRCIAGRDHNVGAAASVAAGGEGMDLARTSFPPSEWAASNS
jgi:hypothetical protein